MTLAQAIIIDDYYDLLHLHRALLEAKFHLNADDSEVQYSPFIAELSNRVVENLELLQVPSGSRGWREWRELSGKNYFRERAIKICSCHKKWSTMDETKKSNLVRTVLSPFVCSDEDIDQIVLEVDLYKDLKSNKQVVD